MIPTQATKIYIAGKVTGEDKEECTRKFKAAELEWRRRGLKTVNPLEVVDNWETPWPEAMEKCLAALAQCDSIYMLPCSEDSRGAQMELDYAIANNYDIYYELENISSDS
jgi:hypothetical protein